MAARVKFNPVTGQYEVQDVAAEIQKKADENLRQIIDDPMSIQRQQQGQQVVPPATTTTTTGQQPTDVTTKQVAGTETAQQPVQKAPQQPTVPQIDVEANDTARQEAIAAQAAANEKEQTAMQSGIDQYNAMVEGWQKERDELAAQQKAAEKDARVSMLISGIADGVASLANLYYTTKGAPNIQLYSGLDKYREIYDKARQRREGLQMQLNQRLQQGQLSLAQLRQQKALAQAKGDAAVGQAKANAALAKQQDITKNQQFQKDQERYEQQRADKEQARQDTIDRDNRHLEQSMAIARMNDARHREQNAIANAQKDLQREMQQTAKNTQSFHTAYGGDVPLRVGDEMLLFGSKVLDAQMSTQSKAIYEAASKKYKAQIADLDAKIADKNYKSQKEELTKQRAEILRAYTDMQTEWRELRDNSASSADFSRKYYLYADDPQVNADLKAMSEAYVAGRNKAYGTDNDDNTPPSMRVKADDDNTPPSMRK